MLFDFVVRAVFVLSCVLCVCGAYVGGGSGAGGAVCCVCAGACVVCWWCVWLPKIASLGLGRRLCVGVGVVVPRQSWLKGPGVVPGHSWLPTGGGGVFLSRLACSPASSPWLCCLACSSPGVCSGTTRAVTGVRWGSVREGGGA